MVRKSETATAICDCCERAVARVRGSLWHGRSKICIACFYVWYDPTGPVDVTRPEQVKAEVLRCEAAGVYPFTSRRPGIQRIATS